MTPYNEDSFSASFESMSIGTQFRDSSNEGNIHPPYMMSYGQPSSNHLGFIVEECGMINYPYDQGFPNSTSNATRISNEHMGESRVSYPWRSCG